MIREEMHQFQGFETIKPAMEMTPPPLMLLDIFSYSGPGWGEILTFQVGGEQGINSVGGEHYRFCFPVWRSFHGLKPTLQDDENARVIQSPLVFAPLQKP